VLKERLDPMGKMEDKVPKATRAQLAPLARMVLLAELGPKDKRARAGLRVKRVPMAPLAERVLRAPWVLVVILATSATPVPLALLVLEAQLGLEAIRARPVQLVSLASKVL